MHRIIHTPFLGHLRIAALAHNTLVEMLGVPHGTGAFRDREFPETPAGQATIVVVFSVITLESYILNYALRTLGPAHSKQHRQARGVVAKWRLIPKLATGQDFDETRGALVRLHELVQARNAVVHLNTMDLSDLSAWDERKAEGSRANRVLLGAAITAFECMALLGASMQKADPNERFADILAAFADTPKYRLADPNSDGHPAV